MIRQFLMYTIYLLSALLLLGCLERTLTFKIRYDDIMGLKQNDPVYFQQNSVGMVDKVVYTGQGDYLVHVAISPEFKNSATRDSLFYIDKSPVDQQQKAVVIEQEKAGGKVLENDIIIEGAETPGLLDRILQSFKQSASEGAVDLQEGIKQLKQMFAESPAKLNRELLDTLEILSLQFQKLGEDVNAVPDSEEMKILREKIKQFVEEFNSAQKDVREQMQREILPQLRKELDLLRRQLKGENREKELDEIDHQISIISLV